MSNPSRRGRNVTVAAFIVIALVAVFGYRFHQLGQSTALASIRSEQERLGIPVETAPVDRRDLARWTNLAGTVEGVTQYAVVSNNALRVTGIPVAEGMVVSEGDVIIRLADEAPNPMFHSASRARANHENVLRDVQRMRNLYAEGAVSKQDLDTAETALRVAETDLQDAEGSTVLRAAEDGVVAAILIKEGETVGAGKPLVWITDTREVQIRFEAGSHQALSLSLDQLAVWTTPEGRLVEGRVTQLDLMADPDTHLLSGEVTFANEDGRLVPGLLVSFRVRTDHRPDVVTVPAASLFENGNGTGVWVVSGDDLDTTANLRPVIPGLHTTDNVEIVGGLTAGERVVVHGQTLLSDGGRINDVTGVGGE